MACAVRTVRVVSLIDIAPRRTAATAHTNAQEKHMMIILDQEAGTPLALAK